VHLKGGQKASSTTKRSLMGALPYANANSQLRITHETTKPTLDEAKSNYKITANH